MAKRSGVHVLVGTKRGLFMFQSDRHRRMWTMTGPWLKGWDVGYAFLDTRGTPQIHAGGNSLVFGSLVTQSKDFGRTWQRNPKGLNIPRYAPKMLKQMRQWGLATQRKIWLIEPGPASEPKVLYAGVAPAALFRSEDRGKHWKELTGLSRHPSKPKWQPGAGGMCLHSIQVDPYDRDRMYVAISAVGAFRTTDGGTKWESINKTVSKYPGAPSGEVGSCVHKMLLHPARPNRLYQQNHVGVYRSDDAGTGWHRIDKGLPTDYGFGLALHPRDPDRCYTIPLVPEQYGFRATVDSLAVYQAQGGGRSWKRLTRGLPQRGAYLSVLRQGFASDPLDPCGLYFGTGGGHLFQSADEGRSWRSMASYLPPIQSVTVAVL